MSDAVCDALGIDPVDRFQSVHNLIDFTDLTIRKGSTPARDGQRVLIPFNMADGSIIARGRGNDDWHQTAPHGAGRRMGRRDAHERLNEKEVEESMKNVYTEHIPIDEAPAAYKNASKILDNITQTVEPLERLQPIHNLKAE
jgi:RNA-splicing ligase RtcB